MSAFKVIDGVVVQRWGTSESVESLRNKHAGDDIRQGNALPGQVEVDGAFVNPPPEDHGYAANRQSAYMDKLAKQLELITDIILNNDDSSKTELSTLINNIKAAFPKT